MMSVGALVGRAAAREAAAGEACLGPRPAAAGAGARLPGEVREQCLGLRPGADDHGEVAVAQHLPEVLAECSVVVVGGGTSGAAAAIAAARRGTRVLLVEYQDGLGGTGTLGLIGEPYHGHRAGFSREVPFPGSGQSPESKMEWYRRQVRDAGGMVWFGVLCCGAYVEGSRVRGVVVATPEGRGIVLADVVIDATGNSDVAAAAGAQTLYGATEDGDIAMQGAGLPARPLGRANVNTDYLFVDESDAVDAWRALVGARWAMKEGPSTSGRSSQTRERRRIVGDHVLDYLDQVAGRTYPDSIVLASTDYDAHGYPNHPYFALMPHTEQSLKANHPAPGAPSYIPYRCLLPRGLDGILVIGLGTSMTRDACGLDADAARPRQPGVRGRRGGGHGGRGRHRAARHRRPRAAESPRRDRQPAGRTCSHTGTRSRSARMPWPRRCARWCPTTASAPSGALAVVLAHAETALRHLRAAHQEAAGGRRLLYARVLAFMGERDVVDQLAAALQEHAAWDAKVLPGPDGEVLHLPTPTDSIVLALGATRAPQALPAILEKLGGLGRPGPPSPTTGRWPWRSSASGTARRRPRWPGCSASPACPATPCTG